MNKKIVHDALVLFAFTVVLGLILGVVYGITKGPIDQVNYEKTQSAYKQVFEDADSFEEYADFDTAAAEDLMAQNGYSDDIEAVKSQILDDVALERNLVSILAKFLFHDVFDFFENHKIPPISLCCFVLYHPIRI